MKNVRNLFVITMLASLVLVGCKKETIEPILQDTPSTSSFKGPGQGNIMDTIFVTSLSVTDFYKFVNTNGTGWNSTAIYEGTGAIVIVQDQNGNYVSGVNVTGQFTGCYTSTVTKKTDSIGMAKVKGSSTQPSNCTSSFAVTSLVKNGYYYDATKNVISSASKVYP
jgi:hypothetical protein